MAEEFDPFAGSSGLPDNFDAVVKDMYFEFDPQIREGQVLVATFVLDTDDPDIGENGIYLLKMSCGDGWDTHDKGATAVRDDGNDKRLFHTSTAYQMWITKAIKLDGAEKVLRSGDRGDPRKATTWIGTAWHIKSEKVDYGTINGTVVGERDKLFPNNFIGLANSMAELQAAGGVSAAGRAGTPMKAAAPVKAAGAVKSAGPAKAAGPIKKGVIPAQREPEPAATNGLVAGTPLYQTLYDLGMAAETHEQFVEQAFEVEGVAGVESVEQAVMANDEGSLWGKILADYAASQV